jgi:carbamoyltransferase
MIYWGISANSHDAAIAVFEGKTLLFASHSERFTSVKNDPDLSKNMINFLVLKYGKPSEIFWYENPLQKTLRQLAAGQGLLWRENNIKNYLKSYNISAPINYSNHHMSHAAAAYYTSPYKDCAALIVDSIGEWDTISIWKTENNSLKRVYRETYPNSLGLFYSAMTQRIGLNPQEDEYILMGMSAYGDPNKFKNDIEESFFNGNKVSTNLHRGCRSWRTDLSSEQDCYDIAAATQSIYEDKFRDLIIKTKELTGKDNIVLAGGCILNCLANPIVWNYFKNVWIFPNPGDAGSSVGAILAHTKHHIKWKNNFLGYSISGNYPVKKTLETLLSGSPVGVANGAAEFGPRALGNRSLLADPRSLEMKDKVNQIKRRQKFRPFAPAILEEFADDYFELSGYSSRYMQYAVRCKQPELIPAATHIDNTARVQTVPQNNHGFRLLLEEWYEATGCPVLLNTSLNIKGYPIVNDQTDARSFETFYNLPVFLNQK